MALDDLLISTGVDQLIRLIKEKGKIELGAAAKELRQPLRTIEDWTHVLEEEGLVAVEYKLTKIYLVWKGPTSEYVSKKAGELSGKAKETKNEVERLLSKVQKGGKELSEMQEEMAKLQSVQGLTPAAAERLRGELSALDTRYSASLKVTAEKLARLRKSVELLGPKIEKKAGKKEKGDAAQAAAEDVARELSVLKNFENTLQSQIGDTETFFEAFEARIEDFRKRIEEGKADEKIKELTDGLEEVRAMKSEMDAALEAVSEEHKAISQKLSGLEESLSKAIGKDDPLSGAKKKLDELRRMEQDAKKQKENIATQLADSLSLVKKQTSRLESLLLKQTEQEKTMELLKNDYVDISEELSRANGELAAKQKEASAKIASQVAALEKLGGAASGVSKEEIEKISFLLRELSREQSLLEEKVRLMVKESELLRFESETVASANKQGGTVGARSAAQDESVAFVEKVRLSQAEETEFERKREELRSLIHRMWEDSKAGGEGNN
jgi:DNA repair exonuclease SbcCD ATPase subunit